MIHALPGMGADRRMFPPPWDRLPEFQAHDWPTHMGENSCSEMAARVCDEFAIRDGDTVIGASLGGMIGCEIAKQRKLAALYLVGSAVQRSEVNRLLTVMRPLISLTPVEWLQFSANRIPLDLAQMFATVDPAFVRAMCRAIFDWEGLNGAPVHLVRIHGGMDFVIPPPPFSDLQIDKAGHLLSMTHPSECVEYIISQDHAA